MRASCRTSCPPSVTSPPNELRHSSRCPLSSLSLETSFSTTLSFVLSQWLRRQETDIWAIKGGHAFFRLSSLSPHPFYPTCPHLHEALSAKLSFSSTRGPSQPSSIQAYASGRQVCDSPPLQIHHPLPSNRAFSFPALYSALNTGIAFFVGDRSWSTWEPRLADGPLSLRSVWLRLKAVALSASIYYQVVLRNACVCPFSYS